MPHIGARSANPHSFPVRVISNSLEATIASSKNIHQSKQQIHSQAVNDFNNKIHSFIEFYTERKCDTSNNVLIHIFETPTGDDDIRGEELKRTIILDLLYRINFAKKSDSKYSQIQSETYTLVNCINKVYKADPDLWHEIIADTASQTQSKNKQNTITLSK